METCQANQRSFFSIILTSMILLGILFASSSIGNYYTVKENWGEYRCQVEYMLLASLFGHDTMENLQFCLQGGFNSRASVSVSPFYGILSGFTGVLATLLSSINSVRMVFSTLIGNISKVFSEFSGRMKALMYRIQYSAQRLKFLMSRVFGTMYAMMYMGFSGIKAGQNFTNTTIFKFMAFMACFPPETLLDVNGSPKQMKDVVIGDMIDGVRVTGTVSILGDGQQMIDFRGAEGGGAGVTVSATHYLQENGKWILSGDSAHGKKGEIWSGGVDRPLRCLITSTHTLPIAGRVFSDYHETEAADEETMEKNLKRINGLTRLHTYHAYKNYITGVDPATELRLEDGTYCPANLIQLGMKVRHGTITAIIVRECTTFTEHKGERFAYATALWKGAWVRGEAVSSHPGLCISFAVSDSAILETRAGTLFRDMFELHDLSIQTSYESAMKAEPVHV
jgi:hypothetical protein